MEQPNKAQTIRYSTNIASRPPNKALAVRYSTNIASTPPNKALAVRYFADIASTPPNKTLTFPYFTNITSTPPNKALAVRYSTNIPLLHDTTYLIYPLGSKIKEVMQLAVVKLGRRLNVFKEPCDQCEYNIRLNTYIHTATILNFSSHCLNSV